MSKQKRRRFSGEEKVKILKKHLIGGEEVSSICKAEEISPTQFYQWQKLLFEAAPQAFESKVKRGSQLLQRDQRIQELEEKLARKNEVLSEAVEALVCVKKLNGDH